MSAGRDYPDRPFLAASAAVFRDGKVLVAARGRPPLEGVFSLPGGLVETGETLAEAALRELLEETGVAAAIVASLRPVEVLGLDESGRVSRHFVIVPHAARWIAGEGRTSPEAPDLRWVAPEDLAALQTTPELPEIVAAAARLVDDGSGREAALTSS